MRLKPDKPIESAKHDTYNRDLFATDIAAQLCLQEADSSIVIGLTAPWGYGKTSCLNLIREKLYTTRPKPIIIEFNPWIVCSVDALLESFFAQFLANIGEHIKKGPLVSLGEEILKYAKHIKPLSNIPQIGGYVSAFTKTIENIEKSKKVDILDSLSVSKQKQKINEAIREINKPIIVFVDDLDRLPPAQLRSVIQLTKAVCDFKRTSFLLSYDPAPVTKALSYDGTYDGFRYLEKIVQSEYRIPKLTSEQLSEKISEEAAQLLSPTSHDLKHDERYLLSRLLEESDFIYLFESPRDINRLFNKLKTCINHLTGEVTFADILFLCGLELKTPELFSLIQNEPYKFFKSSLLNSEDYTTSVYARSLHNEKGEAEKKPIEKIVEILNYRSPKNEIVQRLLEHHFPDLRGYSSSRDGYIGQKRISNKTTLLKAIHLGLVRSEYSYQQAKSFLGNNRNRKDTFEKVFTSNQLTRKIEYIQSVLDETSLAKPDSIIDCVYECSNRISIDFARREINPISKTIGDFLFEICKRLENDKEQIKFVRVAINNAKYLAIPEALLMNALSERKMWSNGKFYNSVPEPDNLPPNSVKLSNTQLYDLTKLWLDTVQKSAKTSDLLNDQIDPISVFYRWGQLNDNDFTKVQNYVIDKAKTNREWFIDLSHSFHQHTEGVSMFQIIPFDKYIDLENILSENQSIDQHSKHLIDFLKGYRAHLEQERTKARETEI